MLKMSKDMFYEPTEADIEMDSFAVEAVWWQNLASRAYASARKHPDHSLQCSAADAAHMARRALRTMIHGPRCSDKAQRAS
jgi:hypothetical protein